MSATTESGLYKPYDQFILFGDSITEMSSSQEGGFGFLSALQAAFIRRLDVINRGFGGYTTAHAIKVLPKFFPRPETATVRFMTIFFGANDAAVEGHEQHVPLETYKENLKSLIQNEAVMAQKPRIILITPPPINQYQLQPFDESKNVPHPSRTAANASLYATAAREVGASLSVPVADIWTAFMNYAGWHEGQPLPGSQDIPENTKLASLLTDGLHLTPEGYRIVYSEVMKVIRANWPDQAPERLSMVFPPWQDAPRN